MHCALSQSWVRDGTTSVPGEEAERALSLTHNAIGHSGLARMRNWLTAQKIYILTLQSLFQK